MRLGLSREEVDEAFVGLYGGDRNANCTRLVKAVMRAKTLRRLIALLVYPIFLATVGGTSMRVVGVRGAVGISLAALAWFVFARLLLNVIFIAVFRGVAASHRVPLLLGCLVVDVVGCLAAIYLDTRLILSALLAIVITEVTIWSMELLEEPSVPVAR